jgi:hypothetical protein
VIVVLATTEDGLPGARARLAELGLTSTEVMAPGDHRQVLLAPVNDQVEGARLVARLRAEGQLAVLRPAGGAPLGAWTRHACPTGGAERMAGGKRVSAGALLAHRRLVEPAPGS